MAILIFMKAPKFGALRTYARIPVPARSIITF